MDTPRINITQECLKFVAEIDEFKGKWQALRTLDPDQLQAMKKVATVESVGSSTRIEGAKLSDSEVEALLSGLSITRLHSRDEAEVTGYAECMEVVFSSYGEIRLDENHIKQLHQTLLRHVSKDVRHRGEYKKHPNHVEAFDQDGRSLGVVFETATPFDTPQRMSELVAWLQAEVQKREMHPLLSIAVFIVHFLAIHPFQDGNGRLSRILTTLLLLQAGYQYVPYCSLERIIEANKEQYYLALRRSQQTLYTDNSAIMEWITFFLRSLRSQVARLEQKIQNEEKLNALAPLSATLLGITKERGTLTVREAVVLTEANRNTIKLHLRKLANRGLLRQEGTGKGTRYRIA